MIGSRISSASQNFLVVVESLAHLVDDEVGSVVQCFHARLALPRLLAVLLSFVFLLFLFAGLHLDASATAGRGSIGKSETRPFRGPLIFRL